MKKQAVYIGWLLLTLVHVALFTAFLVPLLPMWAFAAWMFLAFTAIMAPVMKIEATP